MRETRTWGSVRGVSGNRYPYRDLINIAKSERLRPKCSITEVTCGHVLLDVIFALLEGYYDSTKVRHGITAREIRR